MGVPFDEPSEVNLGVDISTLTTWIEEGRLIRIPGKSCFMSPRTRTAFYVIGGIVLLLVTLFFITLEVPELRWLNPHAH